MKKSLKDSEVFGIIGACILALLVLFSQQHQPEVVTEFFNEQPSQLAQVNPTATLTLAPTSQTVAPNAEFNVNINLNTGGQFIHGVDINKLRFNAAVLEVVDSLTDASLYPGVQILPGNLMAAEFLNTVDNVAGTIQFSQVINPAEEGPYSGSGTLATIRFRAKTAGTSNLTFDFNLNDGKDTNVAAVGGDILASVGSGSYTVSSPDSLAPSIPGTPNATVISSNQVNLVWIASTDNVGVTGYRVERCAGSGCTTFALVGSPSTASYQDMGVTGNTIYRYRVQAVDAAGNPSSYSGIGTANTDATAPTVSINPPTVTSNSATITWTTNEPATTQVDYGLTTAYGSSSALDTTLLTNHSVTLTGLAAGTQYNYRVKSTDAAGNTNSPANQTFTTVAAADSRAPSVPTGITASALGETQIQLSWTASTDPIVAGQLTSGVDKYEVYRNNVLIAEAASAAYLDEGLTAGTAYGYQILAVDNAGNKSAKSTSVTGTTLTAASAIQRKVVINPEGAPATKRKVDGVIEFLDKTTLAKLSFTANISTNQLGQYTMSMPSNVPVSATLRAVIPGYLSVIIPNVELRAADDLIFPLMEAGDFDSNKIINGLDFSHMNTNWGGADVVSDLNKDGVVNTLDFAYLSKNWFHTGQ